MTSLPSILYSNPCASAVVIRNALDPCSAIAVPHRALLPGTVVAVPDRCIHIGHCHGDAGHAGVIAGISAGGGCLSVVDDQRRISFCQIRFLCCKERSVARFALFVRSRIAVEFARQRTQRCSNLRRTLDSRFQRLIVGFPKGKNFAGTAGTCTRTGDREYNICNNLPL